jgi:phage gpG-like protein
MSVELSLKTDFKGINAFIKDKIDKANNMQIPMKQSTVIMFRDVIEHFTREEGPSGKWVKLKPATAHAFVTEKHRRGYEHILVNKGHLRNSLQGFNAPKGGGEIGTNYAKIFTNVEYASAHQEGTKFIPQRKFMWLSEKAKDDIVTIFKNYFMSEK